MKNIFGLNNKSAAIFSAALLWFSRAEATPPPGYHLEWADEFNSSSLDSSKWGHWLLGPRRNAVNVTNAVSLDGSNLVITTYTSNKVHYTGMIATRGKFEPRYGYWESRIRWGDTNGMWSAFWLQSPEMVTRTPNTNISGSEIDIAEHRFLDKSASNIANQIQVNIHWNGYGPSSKSSGSGNVAANLAEGFHTYGFLWTSNSYSFLVDDVEIYKGGSAPISHGPEWAILSSEVDDTSTLWAWHVPADGYGDLSASTTKLTVDYVRYYAPANVSLETNAAPEKDSPNSTPNLTSQTILPGEVWPDNRGKHIQAHGGGILKLGDTYYWFGEDRSPGLNRSNRYVACYSSADLVHWTFRNQVVKVSDPENLGRGWVLERPKVFYNTRTKKFVMYAHIDDRSYKFASVAVFTCDTPDGDYQYLKSFRPLNHESRDIGQFIDDDGTGYLIFEDRPFGFRIAKLSDDYLGLEKEMCLIPQHMEGGAVVHYDGLYYAIGSALTGWNPNPNKYATAQKLEGPWSEFKDIAPVDAQTYGSQSTMMLKVVGTKTTTVIFMGDIWRPRTQWDSRYLWMPVKIGDGKLWLAEPKPWEFDVKTGEAKMME